MRDICNGYILIQIKDHFDQNIPNFPQVVGLQINGDPCFHLFLSLVPKLVPSLFCLCIFSLFFCKLNLCIFWQSRLSVKENYALYVSNWINQEIICNYQTPFCMLDECFCVFCFLLYYVMYTILMYIIKLKKQELKVSKNDGYFMNNFNNNLVGG